MSEHRPQFSAKYGFQISQDTGEIRVAGIEGLWECHSEKGILPAREIQLAALTDLVIKSGVQPPSWVTGELIEFAKKNCPGA